jgi:hypothetical protein
MVKLTNSTVNLKIGEARKRKNNFVYFFSWQPFKLGCCSIKIVQSFSFTILLFYINCLLSNNCYVVNHALFTLISSKVVQMGPLVFINLGKHNKNTVLLINPCKFSNLKFNVRMCSKKRQIKDI